MPTLQQLLDNRPPEPNWTEQEMVDWLQTLPVQHQEYILETLREHQREGLRPLKILIGFRQKIEAQQKASGGLGGLVGVFMEALEGYAIGTALVHGPSAIKNLANADFSKD